MLCHPPGQGNTMSYCSGAALKQGNCSYVSNAHMK